MQKVPVLFIIFNRPDVAIQSFKAIKRYQPERLYIAADGPRPERDGEQGLCEKTRELILSEIDWQCEVKKLFREENVGCGRGPSEAIDWMLGYEEYGIIIEDDCILTDSFFMFCEELLPRYKNNDTIAQISAAVFDYPLPKTDSYYFTGYPHCWGWATWRRAWEKIDLTMETWKKLRFKTFTRFSFPEDCIHFYLWNRLYNEIQKNIKLHVWDYQWALYVFLQKKLCIEPYTNLVHNIGFGEISTHCSDIESPLAKITHGVLTFPLKHPEHVQWDIKREKKRSVWYVRYWIKLVYKKLFSWVFKSNII